MAICKIVAVCLDWYEYSGNCYFISGIPATLVESKCPVDICVAERFIYIFIAWFVGISFITNFALDANFAFDIKALFTSIPQNIAMDCLKTLEENI